MGIRAVVSALDKVAEELRPLYKETDGKFVLDVEGFDDHPTVRGVIVANQTNKQKRDELRQRATELEQRLAAFDGLPDDFDADAYADMAERLEKNQAPDLDEKLAKQRAKLEERFGAEISAREERIAKMEKSLQRMVIDDGLSRAMDEAMIDPLHKSKLVPYLKSAGKITVEEADGSYQASVDTDLGAVSLKQFVTDWAGSEDGKPYVAKSTGPRPQGGHGRNGATTITRGEFEAMSHKQRRDTVMEGVKVVD